MKKTAIPETHCCVHVLGRENRLREIRKAINHPERLDDVTVDMIYSILYNT